MEIRRNREDDPLAPPNPLTNPAVTPQPDQPLEPHPQEGQTEDEPYHGSDGGTASPNTP